MNKANAYVSATNKIATEEGELVTCTICTHNILNQLLYDSSVKEDDDALLKQGAATTRRHYALSKCSNEASLFLFFASLEIHHCNSFVTISFNSFSSTMSHQLK